MYHIYIYIVIVFKQVYFIGLATVLLQDNQNFPLDFPDFTLLSILHIFKVIPSKV
jgi:hypothetical protein